MTRHLLSATYRVQLNKQFTFNDARAIVPYLDRLGISHLYCSPILAARPGSMHGYDVVDPASLNAEIGGEADLDRLLEELARHGMGMILDVVPNHMGVLGAHNPWWQDVLRYGRRSRYAKFFDIGFTEFQADPVGEIRRLYAWLGDELTDDTVDRILAWRADNPKDKYGKHEYNGADFGITDVSLEQRFAPYRDRFASFLG